MRECSYEVGEKKKNKVYVQKNFISQYFHYLFKGLLMYIGETLTFSNATLFFKKIFLLLLIRINVNLHNLVLKFELKTKHFLNYRVFVMKKFVTEIVCFKDFFYQKDKTRFKTKLNVL